MNPGATPPGDRKTNNQPSGPVGPDGPERRVIDRQVKRNPTLALPCKHLRTKTMFYDFNRDAALEVGPICDSQTFWCVLTGNPVGPDGEVVGREECGAHRGCHPESGKQG